ncbi:hypothetical protein BSK59_15835 [Paenibacillus odorifer]|uniref:hypothetical protein n=1 Tax=Paenibacillus odorifer TaxID=189426 RepID=UPI00096CC27D|nr:hypothetical protein [Paenibacillus odorifer]OME54051.1 hypothetical protein BSK59_15835 [Paenibacillus odorifer]
MNILIFLWSIGNLFFQGFVFMKVWNWFPVEIFSTPSISLMGAMGLLLITTFFRSLNFSKKNELNKNDEELLSQTITITFLYAIVLLLGYIIQFFI